MILYHTPTSPFVRKVLVAAHELGLTDRLETRFLRPVPTKADPALSAANPLSKIPALILEDGSALYDSAVICDYLDTLHAGPRLVPASGPLRFRALRQQALCDGILEAAILVFYERGCEQVCDLVRQVLALHGHSSEALLAPIAGHGFTLEEGSEAS